MVASIGKFASLAQGVGYFEKDGYYAKDDMAHREASAWAGKGAEALGLSGLIDPEVFRRVPRKAKFRADGGSGARSPTAASSTVPAAT